MPRAAFGLLGAALTTGLLSAFLFETAPADPVTFAAVSLAILTAESFAGLVPARRGVDPVVALRHE
jgi:hypothetical protein